ncbi:hypothetical protein ACFLWA_10175 [Chloroflexota bacterium]
MRRTSAIVLVCIFGLLVPVQAHTPALTNGKVLYVKPGGSSDCSSWPSACDLQTALATALVHDEIWVAEGVHTPGTSRFDTFQLITGVAVYGGFAGTETSRDQRDWRAHATILSGDLDGDDVSSIGDSFENSLHVVTGSGVVSTAVLDGFTVSGGYADLWDFDVCGGGMLNRQGSPLAPTSPSVITLPWDGAAGCSMTEATQRSRM